MDASTEILRGFFRIGAFIGVCGLLLALVEPVDSGEFVVSVCSAVIGGLLMLGVAIIVRVNRRLENQQTRDEE